MLFLNKEKDICRFSDLHLYTFKKFSTIHKEIENWDYWMLL